MKLQVFEICVFLLQTIVAPTVLAFFQFTQKTCQNESNKKKSMQFNGCIQFQIQISFKHIFKINLPENKNTQFFSLCFNFKQVCEAKKYKSNSIYKMPPKRNGLSVNFKQQDEEQDLQYQSLELSVLKKFFKHNKRQNDLEVRVNQLLVSLMMLISIVFGYFDFIGERLRFENKQK